MNLLKKLNPSQREAVTNTDGPILVLAGAGSGKTRVLTYKVAYLLKEGLAKPWEILAVTFTNKAASEMRARINSITGEGVETRWVGTFHSLFARIMRRHGHLLGYSAEFAIYDREDQLRVMRKILKNDSAFEWVKNPKSAIWIISSIKSRLSDPAAIGAGFPNIDPQGLFQAYEKRMKSYNALDFDDLLVKPLELFRKNEEIVDRYRKRFKYILVDEFQDTNIVQNELLKILWTHHRNITVVGDDDQSIYGWRGAELDNILKFDQDYPEAKIFRLERNYRSTDLILQVAQAVIDKNLSRHGKTLWTERKGECKPVLIEADDDREEAYIIASNIEQLVSEGFRRNQMAVFYRTNAQSRILELVLREEGIPYTIVGGLKFYHRKEIKDLLAYLKLIVNPRDGVSLWRVINFPPRGIGATTLSRIEKHALEKGIELAAVVKSAEDVSTLRPSAVSKLNKFITLLNRLCDYAAANDFPDLVKYILEQTGLLEHFLAEGTEESFARVENLREFVHAAEDYQKKYSDRTLSDFLQEVSLVSETDEWEEGELVNLMTLHCAKGLEFPVVFITGLEEGLFPLIRDDKADIEEERRLFYVGVTRAEDRLYLSYALVRRRDFDSYPSRFLEEIQTKLASPEELETIDRKISHNYSNQPGSASGQRFKRGDNVSHSKFGKGIVSERQGSGDNEIVTVFFQGYGAKKLAVKFAKLKLIK